MQMEIDNIRDQINKLERELKVCHEGGGWAEQNALIIVWWWCGWTLWHHGAF